MSKSWVWGVGALFICLTLSCSTARKAHAQPAPAQLLIDQLSLPAAKAYRPTTGIAATGVDLARFVGGGWEIDAVFVDSLKADSAAIEFQIETGPSVSGGKWHPYDTDNSNARRDGFLCIAGDSLMLAATSGGNSYALTPIAAGPHFPWHVSSLVYGCDDRTGADQTNLVQSDAGGVTKTWFVPFTDAFGNDSPLPVARLIAINRSPRIACSSLTVRARGRRGY